VGSLGGIAPLSSALLAEPGRSGHKLVSVQRLRDQLAAEFARRQAANARYSLRGFARSLGVHHATLSRLLNGRGPVRQETVTVLAARLGIASTALPWLVQAEDAARIVEAIRRETFRPDTRWIASVSNISIDRVNVALQRLLRERRLRMRSRTEWVVTGEEALR
jgi:plasmid maintenance system antidote protein VapI